MASEIPDWSMIAREFHVPSDLVQVYSISYCSWLVSNVKSEYRFRNCNSRLSILVMPFDLLKIEMLAMIIYSV